MPVYIHTWTQTKRWRDSEKDRKTRKSRRTLGQRHKPRFVTMSPFALRDVIWCLTRLVGVIQVKSRVKGVPQCPSVEPILLVVSNVFISVKRAKQGTAGILPHLVEAVDVGLDRWHRDVFQQKEGLKNAMAY